VKREPVEHAYLFEELYYNPTDDPANDKLAKVEKVHRTTVTIRLHWGMHGTKRVSYDSLYRRGLPVLRTHEANSLRKLACGPFSYRWKGEHLTDLPDVGGWATMAAHEAKKYLDEVHAVAAQEVVH